MTQIPVRTAARAGYSPQYQAPARKLKRQSTSQPQKPQYDRVTQSRISKNESNIAAKERNIERFNQKITELEQKISTFKKENPDWVRSKDKQGVIKRLSNKRRNFVNRRQEAQKQIKTSRGDIARAKQGLTSKKQAAKVKEFTAKDKPDVVLQTDKGKVEIYRRAATEGGTYSIETPTGKVIPTRLRGGGTKADIESTLQSKQISATQEAIRSGVSPVRLRGEIQDIETEQKRIQKLAEQEQYRRVAFDFARDYKEKSSAPLTTSEAAQYVNISLGTTGEISTDDLKPSSTLTAQPPVPERVGLIKWKQTDITYKGEKQIFPVLDPKFFTIKEQKAAFQRVGTGAEVVGKQIANVFLPKSKEFLLTPEQATGAERFLLSPATLALAPLAAPAATAGAVGAIATVGFGGIGVVWGAGEIVQDVRYDTSEFKRENWQLSQQASLAARQYVSEKTAETGTFTQKAVQFVGATGISYLGAKDASYTKGLQESPQARLVEDYTTGGLQYLRSRGVEGEDLIKAERFLAAEAVRLAPTEFVGLVGAEVAGNIAGRGILRTATRAIDLALPEEQAAFKLSSIATRESFAGGLGEGGAAVAYFDLLETGDVSLGRVATGAAVGGIFAGGIEFGRTSPTFGKGTRRIVGGAANILEPQEFLVDVPQDIIEGIGRRAGRKAPRTLTPASDALTGVIAQPSAVSPARVGLQTPTRIGITTPSKTPTSSLTTVSSVVKTDVPTTVFSDVFSTTRTGVTSKTDVLATTAATTTSKTQTKAFTTPVGAIAVGFGREGGFRYPRRRKGERRGSPKSLTAQAFDFSKLYKGQPLKKSSVAFASGLGLRL